MGLERRRSPRISIRVLLHAGWKDRDKTILRDAITVSINAHGARLRLLSKSPPSNRIVLENIANHALQLACVKSATVAPNKPGTWLVNVEFLEPAPQFWGRVYSYTPNGLKVVHVDERLLAR